MDFRYFRLSLIFSLIFLFSSFSASAETVDTDNDGLNDEEEINIYLTNPQSPDTDGDGFNDKLELINGFSPRHNNGTKITAVDTDNDGLNDGLELALISKINNPDSDGDGWMDGEEVQNGYDPARSGSKKLEKIIEVDIPKQQLSYFLGRARLGAFPVSTGTASNPTPLGEFKIGKKDLRAWSKAGGLWMPYWMSFYKGIYAIHDLPEWPNGKKEGIESIGRRASHGCVRLNTENAKFLYDWTPIGTKIIIKN